MSWIRRGCARSGRGAWTRTRSAAASPSSAPSSTDAASTTVGISRSRAARSGRRRRQGASTPTGWSPTSASTRRSAFLLGPALGVARADFLHHRRERLIEIYALLVGEAYHDE